MSSRRIGVLSALATMLVVVSMGWTTTVAAPPVKSGKPITVQMTGAAERPGPGDPDGGGTATFYLNYGQGTICYTLVVTDIEPATAAHIHRAPTTDPGPVVVPLAAPTSGLSSGCVDADTSESDMLTRDLIKEIMFHPERFYVNVHNAPFGGGAVRGQLG